MKPPHEYTDAEIRAMEPGRDLDALVDEAIGGPGEWQTTAPPVFVGPRYSTSPGAAFEAALAWCKADSARDYCLWREAAELTIRNPDCLTRIVAKSTTGDTARDISIVIILAARAKA